MPIDPQFWEDLEPWARAKLRALLTQAKAGTRSTTDAIVDKAVAELKDDPDLLGEFYAVTGVEEGQQCDDLLIALMDGLLRAL